MKVNELRPGMRGVDLVLKAVELRDSREVTSRKDGKSYRVAEMEVGDETGTVLLTLWDEQIKEVKEGKVYIIKNGYTSFFKGSIRLNLGRYGSLEKSEADIKVNRDNPISEA